MERADVADAGTQTLKKGDTCWLEIALSRNRSGIEVWVKSDPRVEQFMASLGGGSKAKLDLIGRTWYSKDPIKPLEIYKQDEPIDTYSDGYAIDQPCLPLKVVVGGKNEGVNLSFLRLVGIGSGGGLTFCIDGPFSKGLVRNFASEAIDKSRELIKKYIVPVNISLRISSQDY